MSENISMNVNETRTVTLTGGGTTGFAWSFTAEPAGIVKIAAMAVAAKAGEPVGSAENEDFSITGQAKGVTKVTFTFGRHWEKDAPAKKTVIYQINVA